MRRGPWIVAAFLFITTVTFGVIALQQGSSASRWKRTDEKTVTELAAARSAIRSLNSQVSTLNGHLSSLSTQLSAEANAKEKALDQNTVLSQVVSTEGEVSTELNTCVDDLRTLSGTVASDASSSYSYDPALTTEVDSAISDCNRAQSDDQALQAALSGATG